MKKSEIKTHILVITGAESTGKTLLTEQLSRHYDAPHYTEYAREYIASLHRKYVWEDVEHIARKQMDQYQEALHSGYPLVFFDTWLIITKIWFKFAFQAIPDWIDENIKKAHITGFILNDTDIPWEPDPLRENGGEKRKILHALYRQELEKYGFPFFVNSGFGEKRTQNAVRFIENFL
jgi:nicotinamide riboside kinase